MAAFEQIVYAQHADQPSSGRSLIGKYASLAPFAPEPFSGHGLRRVFLRRRVIGLDHEMDRYAMQFLEYERSIDHRVFRQGLGDLAELELIRGWRQFNASMRLDDEDFR
jgi:hypothetical protein